MENFCEFFDNNIAAVDPTELSGDYGRKSKKKKQIAEAMGLWKGLRDLWGLASRYQEETNDDNLMDGLSPSRIEVRLALLQRGVWLNHSNPYVRVVARLEQFPDEVFRRMLWFYNIDFWSCEAFLRRLSEDDISEINATYDSLFAKNPHLPACMTEGFSNKLRRHFCGKETRDDVFSLPVVSNRRYKKAPAFSINLFGMDFGRARYDDSVNDSACPADIRVQFDGGAWIVNKECGKYDWLFRNIRHNAWWDIGDREVKEGKHFCPGIYTTAMLLAFIFASPLCLAQFLFAVFSQDSFGFWGSVDGLLGLPTLFILLRAAWRGCLDAITSPWEECSAWWNGTVWSRVKRKHEFDKEFWEQAGEYAKAIIVFAFILFVFSVLASLFYFMANESLLFGLVSAAIFTAYWIFMVGQGEDGKMKYVPPTKVPYIGKPASLFLPLWLLWLDREWLLSFILQNLAPILLWSIFVAYAWACVIVPKKFDEWIENNDPRGEKMDRAFGIFQTVLGFMATTALVFALGAIYLIASGWELLEIFIPTVVIFFTVAGSAWYFFEVYNPKKVYWKKSATKKVRQRFTTEVSYFASNAWVRSLDDPTEVLQKVYRLWRELPGSITLESFYSRIETKLDAALYALIDGYIDGLSSMGDQQKEKYESYFFKGVSFEEAVRLVEEKGRKWQEIKQGLYWVYYYLLFGWLFGWVGSVFVWLCEMASHAYAFVEASNTSCPLVESLGQIEEMK